jgi:hypothetical protein
VIFVVLHRKTTAGIKRLHRFSVFVSVVWLTSYLSPVSVAISSR